MKSARKNKNMDGNKLMIDGLVVRTENKEYKICKYLK